MCAASKHLTPLLSALVIITIILSPFVYSRNYSPHQGVTSGYTFVFNNNPSRLNQKLQHIMASLRHETVDFSPFKQITTHYESASPNFSLTFYDKFDSSPLSTHRFKLDLTLFAFATLAAFILIVKRIDLPSLDQPPRSSL